MSFSRLFTILHNQEVSIDLVSLKRSALCLEKVNVFFDEVLDCNLYGVLFFFQEVFDPFN